MVCAHELGIADRIEKIYTLVSASSVNADLLRVNPLGRIPALVTDEGGAPVRLGGDSANTSTCVTAASGLFRGTSVAGIR